jgi:hypothetical protein
MRKNTKKGDHLKKDISLLCLLANESTGDTRRLLEKKGVPAATNHADLEMKLAETYKKESDKASFEKQLAEIHPHKDFILKHCAKTNLPSEEDALKELKNQIADVKTDNFSSEQYHSVCGCRYCTDKREMMSNACGCGSSSFTGSPDLKNINDTDRQQASNNLLILGLVSIVALSIVVVGGLKLARS